MSIEEKLKNLQYGVNAQKRVEFVNKMSMKSKKPHSREQNKQPSILNYKRINKNSSKGSAESSKSEDDATQSYDSEPEVSQEKLSQDEESSTTARQEITSQSQKKAVHRKKIESLEKVKMNKRCAKYDNIEIKSSDDESSISRHERSKSARSFSSLACDQNQLMKSPEFKNPDEADAIRSDHGLTKMSTSPGYDNIVGRYEVILQDNISQFDDLNLNQRLAAGKPTLPGPASDRSPRLAAYDGRAPKPVSPDVRLTTFDERVQVTRTNDDQSRGYRSQTQE